MYHDGPATAYLSQAPGELNDYMGNGEWFKIAVVGAKDGMTWDYSNRYQINMVCTFLALCSVLELIFIVELHHTGDHASRQLSFACRASQHSD